MRLHLVVSRDRGCIRRRGLAVRTSGTVVRRSRHTVLLRLRSRGGGGGVGTAVVHAAVGLRLVLAAAGGRLDVDVGDAAAALAAVAVQRLVLVGRLGELGDDVPGVQQARDVAEEAEQDVDERVGAADAALDPD